MFCSTTPCRQLMESLHPKPGLARQTTAPPVASSTRQTKHVLELGQPTLFKTTPLSDFTSRQRSCEVSREMNTNAHTHGHIHIHTRADTRAQTHTDTHIHTHTRTFGGTAVLGKDRVSLQTGLDWSVFVELVKVCPSSWNLTYVSGVSEGKLGVGTEARSRKILTLPAQVVWAAVSSTRKHAQAETRLGVNIVVVAAVAATKKKGG